MKKIYFFDIDNTLLDHQTHAIPPSALAAIARLRMAGHTLVLATGRSYGHARPFVEQILPDYLITQNGARILQGKREVLSLPLARTALLDLFVWMHELGHCFGVNRGESGFISAAQRSATIPLDSVKMPYQCTDRFYEYEDVHQGWLFFDEALDTQLVPQILSRYPEFDLVRWHRTGMDVMPKGVNKWTGCQWVLAQTGFRSEQAIAFGDGLNDMQMLKGVGLGIAMDNGHPELKAIARRIAPPLQQDGIARMLHTLEEEHTP